jgi:hypothetical protein
MPGMVDNSQPAPSHLVQVMEPLPSHRGHSAIAFLLSLARQLDADFYGVPKYF